VSSPEYSTVLNADERPRNIVLASAAAGWVIGAVTAVTLNLHWTWRIAILLAWTCHSIAGWREITAGYMHYRAIRLHGSGRVELLGPDGSAVTATVQPGSVVLARCGWLRLRVADGPDLAELVLARCCENEAWRRFQVIWRHLGGER